MGLCSAWFNISIATRTDASAAGRRSAQTRRTGGLLKTYDKCLTINDKNPQLYRAARRRAAGGDAEPKAGGGRWPGERRTTTL